MFNLGELEISSSMWLDALTIVILVRDPLEQNAKDAHLDSSNRMVSVLQLITLSC